MAGLSIRSAGRIGTLAAALGGGPLSSSADGAAKGIAGEVAGGPAWIGIGVAGGLVAPLLAVWRTGTMCQPSQQQVKIVWPAVAKLRPAALYIATSPLVKGGASRLNELKAPEDAGAKGKAEVELAVSLQLSHSCVLTARNVPLPGEHVPSGVAKLFEMSLAREDFPTGGAPTIEILRAALKAHERAAAGESDAESAVDPVRAETSSPDVDKGDVHALIGMQHFDGSFDFSKAGPNVVSGMGLQLSRLSALVDAWGGKVGLASAVAHTATALAGLRTRHSDSEDVWGLLGKKAEAWLASSISSASSASAMAGCSSPETCIKVAELIVARWATSPIYASGQ